MDNPDHPRRQKFAFLAGQPAEIARAYDDAMGFGEKPTSTKGDK
jgi:hypothetical protein